MQIKIKPSKIHGAVSVPPSKSITHRAIMIASLAKGTSVLKNYLESEDTNFTIKACLKLGAKIEKKDNHLIIRGVDGKFPLKGRTVKLFVGESGTSLRLLTALSVLTDGSIIIDGKKKLRQRPLDELIAALQNQGIEARSLGGSGCAPVEIKGGKLRGGKIRVVSDKSSQFASALLIIAPYAEDDVYLEALNLKSADYLNLTWVAMKEFGIIGEFDANAYKIPAGQSYKAQEIKIEGDWSSASYFLVAAAITGDTVRLTNLNTKSLQGDRRIVSLLAKMGCRIKASSDAVVITAGKLKPLEEDLADNPDIVPSLCVAAAYAHGKSKFTHVGHLIFKESNRLETICLELKKMGIDAYYNRDQITILGGKPKGVIIDPHNDHRIAMSFAIAALGANGKTVINHTEVVNKSYPEFFADLKKIGAKII